MAYTWTIEEIDAKIRPIIGKPSTSQISTADLWNYINDFYQNRFPVECKPEKLKGWYTQATSVDDDGYYTVSNDISLLEEPAYINGEDIKLIQDIKLFNQLYPKDTGYAYCITDPTLVIGTTSKSAVRNSAFTARIQQYSYSKAAGETELSGDSVPAGKYGAWRLEIDSDGTISIVEADDNATGYDTPAKAVEGLSNESSDNACMGYVTATLSTGAFVPGTTELDASGVTATFTDHFHSTRSTPLLACYDARTLYLGPKADDIYQFKCRSIEKPTVLTTGVAISDVDWGPVIVHGTAIEYFLEHKNYDAVEKEQGVYEYYKTLVMRKKIRQSSKLRRVKPAF